MLLIVRPASQAGAIAIKTPIPRLDETPVELKRLLDAETDARQHQRVQALYLLQTQQARTCRQVAWPLGVPAPIEPTTIPWTQVARVVHEPCALGLEPSRRR